MAVVRKIQNSFTSGELDPKLRGRNDVAAYYSGAGKLRNVLVTPQGGVTRRPGLRFIAELPNGPVRLIPFVYSAVEHYLIVVTPSLYTIYKDGEVMDTVANSLTAAQLPEITWAQTNSTLLIFHQDFSPVYLLREATTTWSAGTWTLNNIPSYNFASAATTAVLTIRDNSSAVIPFTEWVPGSTETGAKVTATSGTPFVSGDVGRFIRDSYGGVLKITSYTSDTVVYGTILHEFGVDESTGGIDLGAGEWTFEDSSISATAGWPRCGTFYQGRLWMASTTTLPNSVWGSRVNDEEDFQTWNPELADSGIFLTAGGGIQSSFHWMHAGKHLFILSDTGEYYIPVGNTEPITPENASLTRNASYGSEPNVSPAEIDGSLVFLRKGGKSVIMSSYNFADGGYNQTDLSLLASHLLNSPTAMAYRKQTNANEADYLLVSNGDGTLAVLCILANQNITGWSLCETEGSFRDVAVDGTSMYFVVDRTIDSTRHTFLEVFDENMLADCAVRNPTTALTYSATALTYDSLPLTYSAGSYSTITGLGHLAQESVQIIVDNSVETAQTVPYSGTLTLENSGSDVQAGLDFPIVDTATNSQVFVESMPIEFDLEGGTSVGRKKRVSEVTIMVSETSHAEVRSNLAVIRRFGVDTLDSSVPKRTADLTITGLLGWADETTISCGQIYPLPFTLLGMAYRVRA